MNNQSTLGAPRVERYSQSISNTTQGNPYNSSFPSTYGQPTNAVSQAPTSLGVPVARVERTSQQPQSTYGTYSYADASRAERKSYNPAPTSAAYTYPQQPTATYSSISQQAPANAP